ncbi:hypothetical protein [Malikia spinosa]|uniref:hypothetical protein n=1 Tax=Malikia spinosa TaxID=86180 RepID=UPI0011B0E360|nr:hypothetical protein [Malikia spinosa]
MTGNSTLISTSDFCRNFPRRPKKTISRESLYEHIENIHKEVSRIIFLEGAELSGKTEFLAGYMDRHPSDSVGVFLTPGDAYFYTPEFLRLVLAEQIHYLNENVSHSYDGIDLQTFQRLIFKLQKIAKKKPITFVIDGLSEPGSRDFSLLQEMLESLPFSQEEFRFILSGSSKLFENINLNKYKPKPCSILPISQQEATEYFSDIRDLTAKGINDIRSFCKNNIGALERFHSLIKDGATLDKLMANREGGLSDILEIEWSKDIAADGLAEILAYVAFANRKLSIHQLSNLTGRNIDDITRIISGSRFLLLESLGSIASLRSSGEGLFLRKKLAAHERQVQEKLASELLKEPKGIEATRYLPSQLMAIGQFEELIQCLNTEHFVRLLDSEHSLAALKRHSGIGLDASSKKHDDYSRIKFGLSGSAISGLSLSAVTPNRLETIIKLGDVDKAMELASLAPTKEEKLRLLGVIGKALHSNRLSCPIEIKTEIRDITTDIDIAAVGLMATDIACDILYVDFVLAVDFFNRTQKYLESMQTLSTGQSEESNENMEEDKQSKNSKFGEINIKPTERHSIRFANTIASIVDRMPATKIIENSQEFEPRHGLLMLKQWLKLHRRDADAYKVANRALDFALKDLSRAPRIQDFRSIAVVLPYIDDIHKADQLIKRIEAQVGSQLALGTSLESIRLELLIERVRYKQNPEESQLNLINIYLKIEQIDDISIKAACLAWMLYSLQQYPETHSLEEKTSLISETTGMLVKAIEQLLASSADHLQAAKSAIYALARADVQLAFRLINQLNSRDRRDAAYSLLADELVEARAYTKSESSLIRCVASIKSEQRRSATIIRILYKIAQIAEQDIGGIFPGATVNLWKTLRASNYRFIAATHSYRILMNTTADDAKAVDLLDSLNQTWDNVLVAWVKTDLAYMLIRSVSKSNPDLAREWLEKVVKLQNEDKSPTEPLSHTLENTAKLVVRCYAAIAPVDCDPFDAEFSRVAHLINSLPVPDARITLWCDLGVKLFFYGKLALSKRICVNQIEAVLDANFSGNEFVRDILIVSAAPLLHLCHPATASRMIASISDASLKDQARREICDVILQKLAPSEPYRESENDEFLLKQNEVDDIFFVLRQVEDDGHIFQIVKSLGRSLASKKNESSLRRSFVKDRLNDLLNLTQDKLPFTENIKHDGYKIACKAYIYRFITDSKTGTATNSMWANLFNEARSISNLSDRVVVIAIVASCARGKSTAAYPNWFSEIKRFLNEIPTILDKIDRYQWIADILHQTDRALSIQLLREGIVLTKANEEDDTVSAKQRKMLDLAYAIDPELVDKLIDESDLDKANSEKMKIYEKQRQLKDVQKSIAQNPQHGDLLKLSPDELGRICLENLGGLNAGRIPHRPLNEFSTLVEISANIPLTIAQPIWGFLIENCVRKFGGNARGDGYVKQLFEASCNAGELVFALIGNSQSNFSTSSVLTDGLVKPGEREMVFERVSRWAEGINGQDIRISDPFFGPDELDFVYRISEAAPASNISILTSRKHCREKCQSASPEDAFNEAWRMRYDITPPDILVGVLGLPDGGHPIHDRWIVCADSGLRLGTSPNSIGNSRLSEISEMDEAVSKSKYDVIGDLLHGRIRTWHGERLQFNSFSLY